MITTMKHRYPNRKALVLRALRISKGFSTRKAARISGVSDASIRSFETSRINISEERIEKLMKSYGCSGNEFNEYMDGRKLPINLSDECLNLIGKMNEIDLRKAYTLLSIINDISF